MLHLALNAPLPCTALSLWKLTRMLFPIETMGLISAVPLNWQYLSLYSLALPLSMVMKSYRALESIGSVCEKSVKLKFETFRKYVVNTSILHFYKKPEKLSTI